MNDDDFRKLVLRLAPNRDRAKLAKLLSISEASAYGWIVMSENGTFGLGTSVRGEVNKAAKSTLIEAGEALEQGRVGWPDIESFIQDRAPSGPTQPARPVTSDTEATKQQRRNDFRRGLAFAVRQLDEGMPTDQVIGSVRTILAIYGDDK